MIITNSLHLQILEILENYQLNCDQKESAWVKKYLGTDKIYHGFSSKEMLSVAQKIIKENNLDEKQIIDLINSLYQNATTYTEIVLAALILSKSPKLLQNFDPKHLDLWLNYTCGWAENDVLCQSSFSSDILLSNWDVWKKILIKFSQSRSINKRRACLVLLTKSLRQSADPKLSKLAFQQIDKLKSEKEILITKAVSWLLRALVKFHQPEVLEYLENNKDTLPKIAYREAFSKATTGRKYNKKL